MLKGYPNIKHEPGVNLALVRFRSALRARSVLAVFSVSLIFEIEQKLRTEYFVIPHGNNHTEHMYYHLI
jgi:hypothetical protein